MSPISAIETIDNTKHRAEANKTVIFETKEVNARVSLLGLLEGGEFAIITPGNKKVTPVLLSPDQDVLIYRRDTESPHTIADVVLIFTSS